MGILNNIEEGLQSMDAYTIKMCMYKQMVRQAGASLKNLALNDPSWYYHTAISTVVVRLVHDTFYEENCNPYGYESHPTQLIFRKNVKATRIKRLFQLDDNEIDILIKADICKIIDDRIYFDNRFINELKVYVLQNLEGIHI